MNEVLKKLFTCCFDNRVIVFETNLVDFQKKFEKLVPEAHGYRWFLNKFKESDTISQTYNGKLFTFQKLI